MARKASSFGSENKEFVFKFDPKKLEIVTDKADALYDERAKMPLDPSFVANVAYHGVLEPVLVTRRGDNEDGSPRLCVVAGRQRVRAVLVINEDLTKRGEPTMLVPVIMVKDEDESTLCEISCSENEGRTGDTPILRAKKMHRLLNKYGRPIADVARVFCCSVATVKDQLKLLSLDAEVQKALHIGQISKHVAISELSKLSSEKQKEALPKFVAEYKEAADRGYGTRRRVGKKGVNRRAPATASPSPSPSPIKGLPRRVIELLAAGFGPALNLKTFEKLNPDQQAFANAVARVALDYVLTGDATQLPKAWVDLAARAAHKAKLPSEAPAAEKSDAKAAAAEKSDAKAAAAEKSDAKAAAE